MKGNRITELTTSSRVDLEKLIVAQRVKKLSSFYGTWRFITVLKTASWWALSSIQSTS